MTGKQSVDGSNVLYHYLQKDLYRNDIWFFQMLVARLVASLGIWFRPSFYKQFPLLRPYAVRDPTCRKNTNPDKIEEWGSPNEMGYFRDDNSLLKGMPSSLKIISPLKDLYNGKCIGKGFVASHVWRAIDPLHSNKSYASRDPWTYSFVPNLVWLPTQVSKLTDREGSFTQLYLQTLSAKIYRDVPVSPAMQPFVNKAWSRLSIPDVIPKQGLPQEKELSFFNDTPTFWSSKLGDIESVSIALQRVISGEPLQTKVVSSRYGPGLSLLGSKVLEPLADTLKRYLSALRDTTTNRM